jgi:ribosomal protein L40E
MALIKCKECSAAVAENAESCPSCGFVFARSKAKGRFEMFGTISGPLILSAAGTLLA